MSKTNIETLIETEKRQILAQKELKDLEVRQQKQFQIDEQKRLEEAKKQAEIKRIEDTRKNFAGTNIIDALEQIQNNKILTWENTSHKEPIKIFGFETGSFNIISNIEPMKISFDVSSVTASYNVLIGDYCHDIPDTFDSITIKKSTNAFTLKSGAYDERLNFSISSPDPQDIIRGIARVVALNQLYPRHNS